MTQPESSNRSLKVSSHGVHVPPQLDQRDWSNTGSTKATWIGHSVGRNCSAASGPSGLIHPAGLKMLSMVDQIGMNSRPRLTNAVVARTVRTGPGMTHIFGSWTSGGKIGLAAT